MRDPSPASPQCDANFGFAALARFQARGLRSMSESLLADRQGARNAARPRRSGRAASANPEDTAARLTLPRPRSAVRPCGRRSPPSSPWRSCRRRMPSRPAAGMWCIWSSASPARRRRAPCARPAKLALERGRIGYTEALGLPALRERIARHYRGHLRRSRRSGADRRHHRLLGRLRPGLSRLLRSGRSRRHRGAGLSRLPQHPRGLGIEPVDHRDRPGDRWAMTARHVAAAHAEKPLDGVLVMSPANPTGMMIERARLARRSPPHAGASACGSSRTRSITA